jgi:uncharacterized membrane protein YesL
MLTKDEKAFIRYWETERLKKKSFLKKLYIGLPLGVLIALILLVNIISGWYQKADMVLRGDSSQFIVILVAIIAIVVFITIFSARHRYDQNELRYQELLAREGPEKIPNAAP